MDIPSEAHHLRDIALATDGVAGMGGGILGEVGTYLPGQRVGGVRIKADRIEIHVVLHADAPVRRTVDLLSERLERAAGRPVQVWVDDYSS